MVKKYRGGEPPQPVAYKLAPDCKHSPIMTVEEIKDALVDQHYRQGSFEQEIACPQCARHEPGSLIY